MVTRPKNRQVIVLPSNGWQSHPNAPFPYYVPLFDDMLRFAREFHLFSHAHLCRSRICWLSYNLFYVHISASFYFVNGVRISKMGKCRIDWARCKTKSRLQLLGELKKQKKNSDLQRKMERFVDNNKKLIKIKTVQRTLQNKQGCDDSGEGGLC